MRVAQAELEVSRNRYRELYESVPIGYITIDFRGRILDLNPAGMDLLGERRGAASSHNFNVFLGEKDLNRFTLFCRHAMTTTAPSSGEFRMKRLDGGRFFGWLQAVPVRIGKAQGRHLRIAVQDITKRKEAEESTHWHSKIDPDSLILIEIRDTSHGPMFCSITNS